MPALDSTGPNGMGALTGRGMGLCVGRRGVGFGGAFKRGLGRGMRFCRWVGVGLTKNEEKEILKQDIADSESYLNSVRKRLSELDKDN